MVVAYLWPPATFTFSSVFAIILFLVVNRICIQNYYFIVATQILPNNKWLLPTPATHTVKCLQRALGVDKKFHETRKLCFYLWVTLPLCQRSQEIWISSILLKRFVLLNKRMETIRNQTGQSGYCKDSCCYLYYWKYCYSFVVSCDLSANWKMCSFQFCVIDVLHTKILFCV